MPRAEEGICITRQTQIGEVDRSKRRTEESTSQSRQPRRASTHDRGDGKRLRTIS
jgi:hypothetical protein